MLRSETVRRRSFLAWAGAGAVLASCPPGFGQELGYTNVDLSTVRVFSVGGIELLRLPREKGGHYLVASPKAGHGSGLKISTSGLVLTAAHVVEGSRRVVVKIPKSRKSYPARVVYRNDERDFAFLAIPGRHEHFVALPDRPPQLGVRQTVDAIGYPIDSSRDRPQSNRGIVAGVLPNGDLQLGIDVNPGNSGGPLVDEQERLLGVVVARGDLKQGIQGIGIAVALDAVLAKHGEITGQGGRFETERAAAESLPESEWAAAALVASLTQHGAAAGMLREIARVVRGEPDREELGKALAGALAADAPGSDVLALAASYHWNAAVIYRHERSPRWRESVAKSIDLCRRAHESDRKIVTRSPFVKFALGVARVWK